MKSLTPYCISLIAISAFSISPALAQWEYGGKVIGVYSSNTSITSTNVGNGATVVVWNRLRGGDLDIYAQYVDSAGYARWDEGGMIIYEDEGIKQSNPAALSDGNGGVFIVWSDWRHTWDQGIALYGQRIDSLGNLLWDSGGQKLTADSTSHIYTQLFDDGHGGFVAVYQKSYFLFDIGAQRVNRNGRIMWDSTGIYLTRAEYDQNFPRTCKATDSTFITCWKDWRDMSDFESDIYIQSFDLDGNVLWDPDGIPAVHWPHHQGYLDHGHDIVADGYGGAVVVWLDSRHYAYNDILYADRFSPSGQSLWQINGKKLGDELFDSAMGCNVFRENSNFIFRWKAGGFRVSYHDLNGDRIWEDIVTLDSLNPREILMEPEGVFKCMVGYRQGEFIYAGSKVDLAGNQYWPNRPFLTTYANKEQIVTDNYGGMIAVWVELLGPNVMISRIYEDGHVGGDTLTSVFEDDIQQPVGITLFQNYPNPFNSSTIVGFRLDDNCDVFMEIFDLLGRKILHNDLGDLNAGDHNYAVNMDAFPSGIYFVRLTTGAGLSGSIKMILSK